MRQRLRFSRERMFGKAAAVRERCVNMEGKALAFALCYFFTHRPSFLEEDPDGSGM